VRATEQAELDAFRDIFSAAPRGAPAEIAEADGALAIRFAPAASMLEVNRIMGLTALEQLDALEPLYRGGPYGVSLDPETGLGPALEERGLHLGYPWQKFVRGVEPMKAGRKTELAVATARSGEDFGLAFAAGYGLPEDIGLWMARLHDREDWHCLVAYDGDEPVGTGALFVSGRMGWLGCAATLPTHRGRGAQGAILAARIDRARELGCTQLVTETGVARGTTIGPSHRNIVRSGFEPAYVRPNYLAR
jgi:GNAT superfamily N-acetyltransferase